METIVLLSWLMQVQINLATKDAAAAVVVANELMDRLSKEGPSVDMSPQMLAELRQKTLTARGVAHLQLGKTKQAREDLTAARFPERRAPPSPRRSCARLDQADPARTTASSAVARHSAGDPEKAITRFRGRFPNP